MESFPPEFAKHLQELAHLAKAWTLAQAHGDGGHADTLAGQMEEEMRSLQQEGVIGEDACQQIFDMALSAAALKLCEHLGFDAREQRAQELADAFNPIPDEVTEQLWRRTQGLLLAAAESACGEATGNQHLQDRATKSFQKQTWGIVGCGRVGDAGPRDMDQYTRDAEAVIPANVIMFSGCQDSQTSADVYNTNSFGLPQDAGPGGAGGACTNSFIKALHEQQDYSWVSLLERMRQILQGKYTQIPCLSSSRRIDLRTGFSPMNPNPNGRTRALLIGINYVGSSSELRGCHNDVETMRRYLEAHGFGGGQWKILMDDGQHERPTKENIMKGFRWLVEGAERGDSLFFHYSGHGSSIPDNNGDEADGKDEALVPLDYERAGMIRDDDIFKQLVVPLKADVTLVCVLDCCHSGSILDLPFMFKAEEGAFQAVESGDSGMQANPGFNIGAIMQVLKDNPALAAGVAIAGVAVGGIALAVMSQDKRKELGHNFMDEAQRFAESVKSGKDPGEALLGAAKGLFGGLFK